MLQTSILGPGERPSFDTSAIAEVDFTPVFDVILSQSANVFDGIDKGGRSAANRPHRRYEISRSDTRDLR